MKGSLRGQSRGHRPREKQGLTWGESGMEVLIKIKDGRDSR